MCLSNFISFALVFTLTRRGIAICVLFFGTSHFNTHVIFPIFHSYLDETGYVYIPFHFIKSKRISILISKLLLLLLFFVIQFINERDSLQFFFLSLSLPIHADINLWFISTVFMFAVRTNEFVQFFLLLEQMDHKKTVTNYVHMYTYWTYWTGCECSARSIERRVWTMCEFFSLFFCVLLAYIGICKIIFHGIKQRFFALIEIAIDLLQFFSFIFILK